jgi:hypothetical protein
MPFSRLKRNIPRLGFAEIDRIVIDRVLPGLKPYAKTGDTVRWYTIFPNGRGTHYPNEKGSMLRHDPKDYFGLYCMTKGLFYPEMGLWLDTCLRDTAIRHSDGLKRIITAEAEDPLRFDRRKPVYELDGICLRYLLVNA